MSKLRIRIKLNPGGAGVRMDKLAKVSGETETFLRFLATDLGIAVSIGDWVAKEFTNSSVEYSAELARSVYEADRGAFNGAIGYFTDFSPQVTRPDRRFKPRTYKQFVDIGKHLDTDEVMGIGLFPNELADTVEWKRVERQPALELEKALLTPLEYEGAVFGRLGTWYRESDYFDLRDLSSESIVKCRYTKSMYRTVYELFEDKDAIVSVAGRIRADRIERTAKEISVRKVKARRPLSEKEFESFFGVAPDMTGEEPTSAFIERQRGDGE